MMADKSRIEWTDATWNPLAGCTKVSPGCVNCYAEKMAKRLAAMGQETYQKVIDEHGRWNNKIELIESALSKPLSWKKPRMIFVNSMSDLFHKDVDTLFIGRVLNVMAFAHWHTFQVLTKRPERMMQVVNTYCDMFNDGKPLPNVWFMTSVENQKTADERIPFLVGTKAVVRGLSCEPLLGKVYLDLRGKNYGIGNQYVNWVIAGGESGRNARPMHPYWVKYVRDQCVESNVPFFFKQWGEFSADGDLVKENLNTPYVLTEKINIPMWKVGKKRAGRLLDGVEWNQYPEVQYAN